MKGIEIVSFRIWDLKGQRILYALGSIVLCDELVQIFGGVCRVPVF